VTAESVDLQLIKQIKNNKQINIFFILK